MPDDLDILTLDEAERAVKLQQNSPRQADDLEQAVTAISRVIDNLRGPVVARAVTGEVHRGGARLIVLREQPVLSVTTVTEYQGTTAQILAAENFPSATTSNDYRLEDGILYRYSSGNATTFASSRVVVTYEAGRYETTADVDQQFKKAAAEILSGNWQKFAGAWAKGGDPFADPVFFDEVVNTLNRWVPLNEREPTIA